MTGDLKNKGPNGEDEAQATSSIRLAKLANRMAHRSYEDDWQDNLETWPSSRGKPKTHTFLAAREAERGRAQQVASATLHYAGDITKTSLRGELRR
jgi:sterol 3beta-glucosyltransferase